MTQMPGFSRDAVQAQLAAAMGQAGESELSGLSAQAVLLVGLEYQALGISDAVQMNYLMQTGGRMLGLTLLMVAAAVLVGAGLLPAWRLPLRGICAAVCSAGWSAFLPLKRTSFPPHPSSPAPPTMYSRSR